MGKIDIRKLIKKELRNILREQLVATSPLLQPPPKKQTVLSPTTIINSYVDEKEEEFQDTLAEIEMILKDNELMTNKTMRLLDKIEKDGKSYILKIKAMGKLVSQMSGEV